MEDNKSSKYEPLASFLNDRTVSSDENMSLSEEELQKLIFLWDKCNPSPTDTEEIWNKTLQKIQKEGMQETVPTKKRQVFILACSLIAASIALLLGFTYFMKQDGDTVDSRKQMEQFMLANRIEENVKEVTLVISDKKKIEIANNSQVAYSQTGQVNVNSAKRNDVVMEENAQKDAEKEVEEYNQIIVPKGHRSMIILADNSKIWVNSGSKVIYPRTFNGKRREIFVEGEVFLKVARDETRPFVVNAAAFEVEVLGTSFNVSTSRNGTQADIVLIEGAVDVTDQQKKHIRMKPDERVELNEAGIAKIEKVNAKEYIHWIDGIWMLNGKPLKEVLQYLTEYYGCPIGCKPAVENETFYGKLYLNEELDDVLESIRQTLPATLSAHKNAIYIDCDE